MLSPHMPVSRTDIDSGGGTSTTHLPETDRPKSLDCNLILATEGITVKQISADVPTIVCAQRLTSLKHFDKANSKNDVSPRPSHKVSAHITEDQSERPSNVILTNANVSHKFQAPPYAIPVHSVESTQAQKSYGDAQHSHIPCCTNLGIPNTDGSVPGAAVDTEPREFGSIKWSVPERETLNSQENENLYLEERTRNAFFQNTKLDLGGSDEGPAPYRFHVSSSSLHRMFTPRFFRRLTATNGPGPIAMVTKTSLNETMSFSHETEVQREVKTPSSPTQRGLSQVSTIFHPFGPPPDPLPIIWCSSGDDDSSWTPATSPRNASPATQRRGRSAFRQIGSQVSTSSVRSRPRSPRRTVRDRHGRRIRRQISVSPSPQSRRRRSSSVKRSGFRSFSTAVCSETRISYNC